VLVVEKCNFPVLLLGAAITFTLRMGLLLLSEIFPETLVWEKADNAIKKKGLIRFSNFKIYLLFLKRNHQFSFHK
jgi:hypothetical protein